MTDSVQLFDINSPLAFFRSLRHSAQILRNKEEKETHRLLYVILGLNHLREWIAPDYKPTGSPTSNAQRFYEDIYSLDSFKLINSICNHTKHMKQIPWATETTYGLPVSQWSDVLAVQNFFDGPPSGYRVDGRDILIIIEELINFYDDNWFSKSQNESE